MKLRRAPGVMPEDERVYAVGDIHGCSEKLDAMHALIREDLTERPIGRVTLLHLGDYVDRGPDSAGVVRRLATSDPIAFVPTVNLIGNHERTMLEALDGERAAATDWLIHGGEEALHSWGVHKSTPQSSWKNAVPPAHLDWVRALSPAYRCGGYFFAHAGIRPGIALDKQELADLVSIRHIFLTSERDFGAVVVHGHTVKSEPVIRTNRIGIDTGAVYGGKLTCLVLEADRYGILQV